MKQKLLFYFLLLFFQAKQVCGQVTDLFISEYVEGTSFNKAIELYNGTAFAIDLAANQYYLQVYFNGNTTASALALTGTINAGATLVLAHTQATLGLTPAITSTVLNFNGNDAVVLRKNGVNGAVLDVIGEVSFNPGTQWGGNDTCTLDRTMRRKPSICVGDTSQFNVFHPSQQWDGFPINTFTNLGTHASTCGAAAFLINPSNLSFTAAAQLPSGTKAFSVITTQSTSPYLCNVSNPFEISSSISGSFSNSLTLPASASVQVFVRFVPTASGIFNGSVSLSVASSTAQVLLTGTSLSITTIPKIQGTASVSTYTGTQVVTKGIVTGDFQAANQLGGFFLQDALGDNNPLTSDGIFVANTSASVAVGDLVILEGTVQESFSRTQLSSITAYSIISTSNTVAATSFTLPFTSVDWLERMEGMLAQCSQSLSVSDVYTLGRFGEVILSNGRLINPTHTIDVNDQPASGTTSSGATNSTAVIAQQTANALNQIVFDDASNQQNPSVVPYVDPLYKTLRSGSVFSTIKGNIDYSFNVWRLQPVLQPAITYAARPSVPSVGAANVKVASFNVLNFFNGNGQGGGFPTTRGASTASEFVRQKNKIVQAITQLNADVIGIMEMENDGDSTLSAIADLVNGLNAATSAGTYTFVNDPAQNVGGTGSDEIKVALLYKPAVVSLVKPAIADSNLVFDRHPLAQTFNLLSTNLKFNVIVTHLKSKSCAGATGADVDQNDGQSCYNNKRRLQAAQLLLFADSAARYGKCKNTVIIGDYNADEEEDPIDKIRAGGWNHLINGDYSFVFDAQAGTLDHAFVSDSMLLKLTGASKWHINADEPVCKDYNEEFNPALMYNADAFRSSDHDPILLGFLIAPPQPTVDISGIADSKTEIQERLQVKAAHENLLVKATCSAGTPIKYCVYTSEGEAIVNGIIYADGNGEWQECARNCFSKGMYIVKLETGGRLYYSKLMIGN